MPRKASHAVVKDTAVESKNEGSAPRRSGRAVTKPETSGKDVIRSRRSSTAAQTAASVADSKTPKGRSSVSSRRESSSPSDSRTRTGREGGSESPATRVKSTRRNASRINYKESDGEEEAAAPKFDDNFVSGEEFDDSESDEKSKRGRSRSSKQPAKGRGAKDKPKGSTRSRRGRPSKKKEAEDEEEEENETVDVSDDSAEPEETPAKRGRASKAKEPPKSSRGRRQRSEVAEEKDKPEEKPKASSRRSSRTASNKEETPTKKRPSRGVQAKRYTEEEEEDIEELSDSKPDAEEDAVKEEEGSRKRKREDSPEEPSKRVKEKEAADDEVDTKAADAEAEEKIEKEDAKPEEKAVEEPMEVDESDAAKVPEASTKPASTEDSKDDPKPEVTDDVKMETTEKEISPSPVKESGKEMNETSATESSEKLDEEKPTVASEQTSKPQESVPPPVEEPKVSKENLKPFEAVVSPPKTETNVEKPKELPKPEVPEPKEDSSVDSKSLPPPVAPEVKTDNVVKNEQSSHSPVKSEGESVKKGSDVSEEAKPTSVDKPSVIPSTGSSVPVIQSKESNSDSSFNGAEKDKLVSKPVPEIHSNAANVNSENADNIPKANGAHNDVQHTNSSVPTKEQYYCLPGRKYVINSKLSESLKQSVKNKTFGFVSYNLATSSSDVYISKEKLINELNNLDAHLICLQQVAKPFYTTVLEPSLDALGFKSIFSQPEDSLKGMATFYKSSLFRLSGHSDISLKQLIEKDLETASLEVADRSAVKAHVRRCGNVLFTHFSTVMGAQTITVANVQIPPTDLSIHALQVSCLAKEVVKINEGSNKPLLIGGEFNIAENDASYQLLKDGYLSNEMIEELQRRRDVVLPGKENASLVNLLWKSFQHPSSNLCSCYTSVLGHEFFIPELKIPSPDLVWYSSDSLCTVGVLDLTSGKPGDRHFSLKADVAFNV